MARLMTLWCFAVAVTFGSCVASPSDLVCQACLSTTQDIRAAVTDRNVHVRVLSHLETVCEFVSSERRDVCKAVVDGLTQEVLYHLLASMDPSELCVAMTACSPRTEIRNQVEMEPSATLRLSSDTCELCQVIVRMVDTWLQNRTNPSAANATVVKLCDLLSEPNRDVCITFAPLIVDAIMKGVDPIGACTNIGLCLSEKDKSKTIPKSKAVVEIQAGPMCELCELLVQTVDTYLKDNKTEAAINATVYKVCNSLPDPIKSMCLGFAPQLVSILSKGADPQQACTYLKLCTSAGAIDNTLTLRSLQAGPMCELCELLVQTVDTYLKDNKTEAAINATVYKVCNSLPDPIKSMCLGFAPQLVSILSKGADPQQACTYLKLCTSAGAIDNTLTLRSLQAGPMCELCELLVQTVDTYLKDNKTEAAINATVYKVCNSLPDPIKSMCLGFAPQLVSILSKGADPQQACTYLKLCTSAGAIDNTLTLRSLQEGPECELCELLINIINIYLKDNKTEAAINATVYKVCDSLSGAYKVMLVTVVAKGLDPLQACAYIKICSEEPAAVDVTLLSNPQDGPLCEMCELLIQTIDTYLKDNKTEAAINATVYKVCNSLPETIKAMCLGLAPQLITVISQGLDPKQACTYLKICTSVSTINYQLLLKEIEAGPMCELCELLIQTVDTYLKDNKTEAAINATVYKVCNSLPDPMKSMCLGFAPEAAAAIAQGVDPQQTCTYLKLCTSGQELLLKAPYIRRSLPGLQDVKCDVCKNALGIVDNDLYQDEGKVQTLLEDVCHRLPPPTDQACLNAVDEYFPQIWENILSKGASPESICKLLRLCSS